MKKFLSFLTLIFLFLFYSKAQVIPEDDINPICDGQSISMGAPGNSGINNITIYCNEFQPLSPYIDFYYVRIMSGTTFTFLVEPVGNDDYDFGAWLNPDLNNLGSTPDSNVRGSQNDPNATGVYHLGLSLTATDLCEGGGSTGVPEPGLVRYFDVQPGDEILIAIDRWSQTSQGYTISFGGDSELDCTIVGDSYGKCDVDGNGQESFLAADFLPDLNADFPGGQFEFYTTQQNAENGTGTQVTFPHPVNIINNPSELFVRVENSSGAFVRAVQIFLYVNEVPQLSTPVSLPPKCDLDGDDEESFDLTQAQSLLVSGPNLFTYKFYESQSDAIAGGNNNITTPTAYDSGTATIYVRVETGPVSGNEEGCFSIGEINLILTPQTETVFDLENEYCLDSTPPALSNLSDNGVNGTWSPAIINTTTIGTVTYTFTPNLNECATEFQIEIEIVEGITPQFNLETSFCQNTTTPILPLMSDNAIAGTWFPAAIDSSTPGVVTYTFTPDDSNCTAIFEIEIEIIASALLNNSLEIELCDENFDGIYEYNLTELNSELINPTTGLIFSYYATQQDFDNDNPIPQTEWNNYEFNNLPTAIIVAAENAEGCISEEVSVQFIEGQGIILLDAPYQISFCEGETVNLTEHNSIYTNETVTVTYYATLENAQTETSPLTAITNYSPSIAEPIYVRLEKLGRCPEIIEVEFILGQEVQHNSGTFGPINFCEDETIDLTAFENDIALETGVNFTYYESLLDAENQENPITDETAYLTQGNGIIYVRLTKTDRCAVIIELAYQQRPNPIITGLEPLNRIICEGNETIEIEASTEDSNASFLWTWGNNQSQSGAAIEITQSGTYILTVTDSNGCISTEELIIEASPAPIIRSIESGNNYLVVSAEATSGGTLEYSLNNVMWQTSPRFDNLVKGEIYTIYVRENGCEVTSYQAVILDVPNFISPNGDGYNDQWTIRGIEITPDSTIKIFDRYGKIFIDTNFDGNYVWDGKYAGRPLPSGDYWYIMQIPSDGVIVAQKFVGHVSIKNL
ncbi:T9SS type B sorting domain-containing protein [Moheibacter sediminis]|uniref:Gliding motility-associated C-terminal domain-containing protein n=1 Tax=Moheibacter sediminis TaxID=1434700 RepID=A0A1W2C3K1_9FLAO|nr:T9SS type B sorting domain-containing protein [Moheibacter sediminis]SMC79753.1 gliding motility-associated C-terminal domain-containing protein [Moheibacter sediminis]